LSAGAEDVPLAVKSSFRQNSRGKTAPSSVGAVGAVVLVGSGVPAAFFQPTGMG
jgi:hypothetical protein